MIISFTVLGEPVPKARPRFFRRGKFIGTYTPKESQHFEDKVRIEASLAVSANLGPDYAPPKGLPVAIAVRFYFLKPAARMKKKTAGQNLPRAVRPDVDNLLKSIFDGLNGVFFRDDGQIYRVLAEKWEVDANPRCEVDVELPDDGEVKTWSGVFDRIKAKQAGLP